MDVTIAGASGYTGSELLRILSQHEKIEGIKATSRTYVGEKISSVHNNLKNILDMKFTDFDLDNIDSDIVFLCLPHTKSMEFAQPLVDQGIKVIDLSADYRIKDTDLFEEYYCIHENPELLQKSVYGLPELNRKSIKKADLIANPGCYATAALLGLIPLMKEDKLDLEHIVVDAKSGTSGAGVKPSSFLQASEVVDNLKPYKVTNHRHQPEIDHILQGINKKASVNFTPTLMPFSRGIQETIHIFGEVENPEKIYEKFYKKEPFVRITKENQLKNVVYSNYCDISLFYDDKKSRLVTITAIDNSNNERTERRVFFISE